MELLKSICSIHAPSGEEFRVRDFIINFVEQNFSTWKQKPTVLAGKGYQDNLLLCFGKPKIAVMSHMDSVGFTAGYNNELIPIGTPATGDNAIIRDSNNNEINIYYNNQQKSWIAKDVDYLEPGTTFTWKPSFNVSENSVESPFLDNRLGIYTLLKLAPNAEDVIFAFSTYEEISGGGSARFLAKKIYEDYKIDEILISDITWVTNYVKAGNGVVISLRDMSIPRKLFVDKIKKAIEKSDVKYQFEVESAGGSDGTAIQNSDYPIDWIFIGAPEINPHGSIEIVNLNDIKSMIEAYSYLLKQL